MNFFNVLVYYLFICSSYNDPTSNSDFIMSNVWMTVDNVLERTRKEEVVRYIYCYPPQRELYSWRPVRGIKELLIQFSFNCLTMFSHLEASLLIFGVKYGNS
jgi:hypothetical protein